MIVISSVVLSAIGVGLFMYSLFSFILSLSDQRAIIQGTVDGSVNKLFNNTVKLNGGLKFLGISLIVLLFARMILSLSLVDMNSEFFYYGIFINVVGSLAIAGLIFQRSKLGITELTAAFSVICISLIVFILDYVFL